MDYTQFLTLGWLLKIVPLELYLLIDACTLPSAKLTIMQLQLSGYTQCPKMIFIIIFCRFCAYYINYDANNFTHI
jgi:hypothetical protein